MFWVTCTYAHTHTHTLVCTGVVTCPQISENKLLQRLFWRKCPRSRETNTTLFGHKALDHNGNRKLFAIKTVPEGLPQLTFVVVMTTWDVWTGAGFSSLPNWSATDMLADLPVGSGSSSSCTRLLSGTYIILPVISVNKLEFNGNLQTRKKKTKVKCKSQQNKRCKISKRWWMTSKQTNNLTTICTWMQENSN